MPPFKYPGKKNIHENNEQTLQALSGRVEVVVFKAEPGDCSHGTAQRIQKPWLLSSSETETRLTSHGNARLGSTRRGCTQKRTKPAPNASVTSSGSGGKGKTSDVYPAVNHRLPRMMCRLYFVGIAPRILAE